MMRTWASENLQAAWEIIAWSDFDINNIEYLYVKPSDLIDLREAIRAVNTELATAQRQRDEALAANEGLKARLTRAENEKDLAYKQIEFLQIINELAGRADN